MKPILFIFLCVFCTNLQAQTGVNTKNPQGVFHVDGAKDNPSTGAPTSLQAYNDVIITSLGNLGLGTLAPTLKLEIHTTGTGTLPVPGFRLVDGNEFNNYVLTSDANGVGTWKPISTTTIKGQIATADGAGDLPFSTSGDWHNTNSYIDIPIGKWKIDLIQLLKPDNSVTMTGNDKFENMWFRFTFGDVAGGKTQTDDFLELTTGRLVSGIIEAGWPYGLAQGSIYINNTSGTVKRYYLLAGSSTSSVSTATPTNLKLLKVGGNVWAENVIFALSIN